MNKDEDFLENLNDIKTNLEENIDLFNDVKISDIEAETIKNNYNKKNTSDIRNNLSKINLIKNKFIRILKNNTKNFDSIVVGKKLKDIYIIKKNNFSLFFNKNPFNKDYFSLKNLVRPYFLKKLGIIFLIFFIFLFLDKFIVEYTINSGYKKILSIKKSKNINDVKLAINNAKFDFILGNFLFKPFLLIPNNNIKKGYNIIAGGKQLTSLLDDLLRIYSLSSQYIEKKGLNNIFLSNLLFNLKNEFITLENNLKNTLDYYNKIGNINNPNFKNKFILATNYLKIVKNKLDIINHNYDTFLSLFGNNHEKTYLIVFQNSDEIRATGGFMGSMGLIKIFKGKIINFETKDIYALEWDLQKSNYNKLKAPKGINRLTENFGLRDSNYYINIKKSSDSINYFIKKAGYNIDGIIYLNKNIILDFLKITGSIKMKNIGEDINNKNFSRIISLLVEAKLFKKGTLGTPKEILFSFIKQFRKKILSDKDYSNYLKIIFKNIISRDIIFYSFNIGENKLLSDLGINGKINYNNSLDFSYPVYTSISGNKSGRYMKRTYEKEIKINPDCSIETNLNIISKHTYNKIEENKLKIIIKKYNIKNGFSTLYIQGAGENRQYVRLLLPKKAIIKKSNRYQITKLNNFNLVEFFLNTRKSETTKININYSIRNKDCSKYNYIFYKQPGIKKYNFKIKNKIEKNGIEGDFTYTIKK